MQIICFHIDGFGKLTDFPANDEEFTLDGGLNNILQGNGWGKSTIMAFIRCMFYGLENDRKRKDPSEVDRVRYLPWKGGPFGGRLDFRNENGRYRIVRAFSPQPGSDSFVLYKLEMSEGRGLYSISEDYSENIGEELFKIDAESFRHTIYIGQARGGFFGLSDDINAKIGNVSEENDLASWEEAAKLLEELIKDNNPQSTRINTYRNLKEDETKYSALLGTEQATAERLKKISQIYEDAAEELESLDRRERLLKEERSGLSRRKDEQAVKDVYNKLEADYDKACEAYLAAKDALPEIIPERKDVDDAFRLMNDLERAESDFKATKDRDEINREFSVRTTKVALENARVRYESELNKGSGGEAFRFSGIALIIIGLIYIIVTELVVTYITGKAPNHLICIIPFAIFFIIGLIFIRISAVKKKSFNERLVPLQSNVYTCEEEYKQARELHDVYDDTYVKEIRRNLYTALAKLSIKPDEIPGRTFEKLRELDAALSAYAPALKAYEYARNAREEYEQAHPDCRSVEQPGDAGYETLTALDDELNRISLRRDEVERTLDQAARDRESCNEKLDEIEDAKAKLKEINDKLEQSRKTHRLASVAAKYLNDSKEAFTSRYSKGIWEHFSEYYGVITESDAAGSYQLDSNLNLKISEGGRLHDLWSLSGGFAELVGFCMRLAVIDAMYTAEKPPLIMDETFAFYDADKERRAYKLLEEVAKRYQIIYMRCK